ncbi:hypothetical protein D3C87_199940 [compost metagenome]
MEDLIKYTCSVCGKEHEEWPALAYNAPQAYLSLSEREKEEIADLTDDFCVIRYEDQTDRFIRCTLTQKVTDHCEDLEYGFWVSLSEKSFNDYDENYHNENHETVYFGWMSNFLPEYKYAESIPTNVYTRSGNQRPEIVPHEDSDHPFVKDYYQGITKAEAERRINYMLNPDGTKNQQKDKTKSWWKRW